MTSWRWTCCVTVLLATACAAAPLTRVTIDEGRCPGATAACAHCADVLEAIAGSSELQCVEAPADITPASADPGRVFGATVPESLQLRLIALIDELQRVRSLREAMAQPSQGDRALRSRVAACLDRATAPAVDTLGHALAIMVLEREATFGTRHLSQELGTTVDKLDRVVSQLHDARTTCLCQQVARTVEQQLCHALWPRCQWDCESTETPSSGPITPAPPETSPSEVFLGRPQ